MGYELKAVGLNKRGSACNGISVMKNIVLSAFLSGGLAAAAGGIEVLAIQKNSWKEFHQTVDIQQF